MKERAKELKVAASAADGENDVLTKIDEMLEPDRCMPGRLDEIIKASTPVLAPITWYGMPAYARESSVLIREK